MKELTRLMKELEDQLSVCMRCGMCQAVCPVFAETGRESDVARGKLALLDGLTQELFKDPKGTFKRLNRCLLCGSCATNCPTGVNVLEIFIKARVILTGFMGLSPVQKLIFRGILASPQGFDRFMEWAIKFQNLFTRPDDKLPGTSHMRLVSPLIGNRHFTPLAPLPFHRILPSLNTKPGRSGIKVGFFVGCLIDKLYPRIAQAVIDVLEYHGVGVFMPKEQGCCGMPAISSGDAVTFDSLVRYNLEKFDAEKVDYIVTACATCTFAIRKIWPVMLRQESSGLNRMVERLAKKTMDINRFLVSVVGIKKAGTKRDYKDLITYHDPCHLSKSLGVSEEPRALIQANPGCRLIEMPDADRCCGSGGSFNLQHYKISTDIGRLKRDNIITTGCSIVATGCPACMLQISDMLSKSGYTAKVKHPIEIYDEYLKSL
ncbi:MAG: (Fe-S)-binding protein [Thermodesulfobacteriota bacterium]|nr:(Fe-S)-binding protein [Thermodesulfobacteriota bacterium]